MRYFTLPSLTLKSKLESGVVRERDARVKEESVGNVVSVYNVWFERERRECCVSLYCMV